MTAQMVLAELQEAWANERLAPELLPHKSELVEVMMEQVEQMEANVKQLATTDLRSIVHRQELERIRYLVRSYLRTRLSKIEQHCLHLVRSAGSAGGDLLSPQEAVYLREYTANAVSHLKVLLDNLPRQIANFNVQEMESEPELETHVFVRSKVDVQEALMVGQDDEVNIQEGSQFVLPYSVVQQLVRSSKVILL
ncbi:hypothetical protein AAG570_007084 [Ranatra chinensis]|uniref:DNA replication complex GINS protein SLD5 n=1 Tax=Ranatra chinensis TaxID=642074 RepID=A0ABD0Y805_9HEMI